MKANESSEKLSLRMCHEYLEESVFKLSPPKKEADWPGYVGIELEMLPVLAVGDGKIPPPIPHKDSPVTRALGQLAKEQNWEVLYEEVLHEKLMLVLKIENGETITFEPGGQIEYSSQPFRCLDHARRRVNEIQSLLENALNKEKVHLLQIGLDPWHSIDEIGIRTPKKRYLAMNEYFQNIHSASGLRMMRQTCSIQVCLDFGQDDSLMTRRYLAAQMLAPTTAALFSNSPYSELKFEKEILSHRTAIWRNLDTKRSGFVGLDLLSENLTRESCIQSYLDFALSCPIVFVEELGYLVPKKTVSMKEWMTRGIQGVFPTLHDFVVHLSLLFPEVRPRSYLELRSIDCLPRTWQIVPAAFYVGLLYDQKNLETVLGTLVPVIGELEGQFLLASHGLQSQTLREQAKLMVRLSIEGLQRMPDNFCGEACGKILTAYYHHFTERGRCPANDLVDFVKNAGRSFPNLSDFARLENQWRNLIV